MREDRHGRCGARYPERGTLLARERDGKRYVGNYVREAGRWRRLARRDLDSILAMYLEEEYAEVLFREHPIVELMRKRGPQ